MDKLKTEDLFQNRKGIIFSDTVLSGMIIFREDGTREYIEATNLIVLKTAEENNKKK